MVSVWKEIWQILTFPKISFWEKLPSIWLKKNTVLIKNASVCSVVCHFCRNRYLFHFCFVWNLSWNFESPNSTNSFVRNIKAALVERTFLKSIFSTYLEKHFQQIVVDKSYSHVRWWLLVESVFLYIPENWQMLTTGTSEEVYQIQVYYKL